MDFKQQKGGSVMVCGVKKCSTKAAPKKDAKKAAPKQEKKTKK
jgi:hypothetical protein